MSGLYHYTCDDHGRRGIGDSGELLSPAALGYAERVEAIYEWQQWHLSMIWMTDMDEPYRDALGLTRHTINCDRTAHRYRVADDAGVTWYPRLRRTLPVILRDSLEYAPGAMPAHWWVSYTPVPVVYDPIAVAA